MARGGRQEGGCWVRCAAQEWAGSGLGVAGRLQAAPSWLDLLPVTRKPRCCTEMPGQFQAGPQPAALASPAWKGRPRLLIAVWDAVSFVLLHQKGLS